MENFAAVAGYGGHRGDMTHSTKVISDGEVQGLFTLSFLKGDHSDKLGTLPSSPYAVKK